MPEKALELASHITNPVAASAFAAVLVAIALWMVVKRGKRPIVWLLAPLVAILGLAPLMAQVFLATQGVYRISVTVLGLDGLPYSGAVLKTQPDAEIHGAGSGFEVLIPPQTRPADTKIALFASAPSAYLIGKTVVELGSDYYPTAQIQLGTTPSVTLNGEVLDERNRGVADAQVVLPDCSSSTTTDANGLFHIGSCKAEGQMIAIQARKGDLSDSITIPARDGVQLHLRDNRP